MSPKKANAKQDNEKKSSVYTGGFLILLFIFLMTLFLMLSQPKYYHTTIIFFGFGFAILVLITILFAMLQKPVQLADLLKKKNPERPALENQTSGKKEG